jgi:LAO/AO transport system kinase
MKSDLVKLVDDATAGGPRSLRAAARLMSVITDQPQRLGELLAGSRHWTEPRLVLGVTGAPGSGKSTLVDHLAAEYRHRYPDGRLGIVAVDPSSPYTGGALLGDRVRMMRHATDPHVFIRSLASRGQLGGLALGAKGVVRVMGLIGCDVVIVETVGVGQCEVEIAQNADVTMVVLAPGQGDSIQMLKAGLIEAGDVFVVNKADRPDAVRLQQQLLSALRLRQPAPVGDPSHNAWPTQIEQQVFLCSAINHKNIAEVVDYLEGLEIGSELGWQCHRRELVVTEVRQALAHEITQRIERLLGHSHQVERRFAGLLNGSASVADLADELLDELAQEARLRKPATEPYKPERGGVAAAAV